jgi:hypothetical protein
MYYIYMYIYIYVYNLFFKKHCILLGNYLEKSRLDHYSVNMDSVILSLLLFFFW